MTETGVVLVSRSARGTYRLCTRQSSLFTMTGEFFQRETEHV